MEKTMIVKWQFEKSETIPILKLLPELVEESRTEKSNISLKTILMNPSFARAKHKQTNTEENYGK
jgi:hypothetical protein